MANLLTENLVDSTLAGSTGVQSGYNFAISGPTATAFVAAAAPTSITYPQATGTREFCMDQSGVLTAKTAAATAAASACTGFTPTGN
jgi:hypothetical protein